MLYLAWMPELQLGQRVLHASDRRYGWIIGHVEKTGWNKALVRIAVENSTRFEYWPLTRVVLRPLAEQLVGMGGSYEPPKGFPLNT